MKLLITVLAMVVFSTSSMAGNKGLMGALIGAGVGAGVGHAVDRTGGSGKGAIIGAVGGYVIGNQMEKSDQRAPQPQAAQPPAQTSRQGSSVNGSRQDSSDCVSANRYVDRATKTGDNDDRVYFLEKAVKLCPYQARAHNDLGVAYYKRNNRHDRDRARSEFNEALKIDPGYTVARNNLSNLQ
ncbi:MAG: glycine zipper 2TM domain-containing protein [Mariprofundus sp.]|nr:glycine zipper 2TM domain-containing protein [Mariprofundus sp.]